MADEGGVQWIANPYFWANRYGLKPQYIIVHGTDDNATPVQIMSYMSRPKPNPDDNNSVHYCVGRDGSIVQSVLEKDAAWGNGGISGLPGTSGDGIHHDTWWDTYHVNPNLITISIEHVNWNGNSQALTDAQKLSSFKLIQHICERHGIPKRKADANGGITGHFSMDPANRSHCPGNYPWPELFSYLASTEKPAPVRTSTPPPAPKIPAGWNYDSKTGILKIPGNSFDVRPPFSNYILSRAWDSDDEPLENAQALDQLEISNPHLGPGMQQLFNKHMLGLKKGDPADANHVINEYVGKELAAILANYHTQLTLAEHDKALILQLQSQMTGLNTKVQELQTTNTQLSQENNTLKNQLTEAQNQLEGASTSLKFYEAIKPLLPAMEKLEETLDYSPRLEGGGLSTSQ